MTAASWAIGIDVGGTKIAGGLVRLDDGAVEDRLVVPTGAERGPDAILSDVVATATRLRGQATEKGRSLAGLGVGVPELVDLQGRVTSGQTIDWRGVDLHARLAAFGQVHVEADVRAAALAEAQFGAGRGHRVFVYVSVGTGISSVLVQNGRPFAGARGNALVLASGRWESTCSHCGAEEETVVEDVASGAGLVRRYQESRSDWSGRVEDIVLAAANHDPEAVRILQTGGATLANAVAFLVNILDPEIVVVGGGLGLSGGLYWDAFVKGVRRLVWADAGRDLPLVPAALGVDAGIIGAALGAWQRSPTTPYSGAPETPGSSP